MPKNLATTSAAALGLLLVAGCSTEGPHSSLDPGGDQAGRIARLWWIFFWVCLGVYLVTMAVVLVGAFRRRSAVPGHEAPPAPQAQPPAAGERALGRTVAWAVSGTVMLLLVLLASDVLTARALHAMHGEDPDPLVVSVTGHQWWWEVQYPAGIPADVVATANVVHVPVGKVVKFEIRSADVIHSFWVPNLHGKKDMIPGHDTSVWVKADRPGTYVGECAEFCGAQHAKMRFTVVAEPPERFAAWLAAQRQPAASAETLTASQAAGRQVFLTRGRCFMCHGIVGTPAGSRVGPDLTHLKSRPTIAAGTLPNTPGHLAGWIVDPQMIKPGCQMTQNPLNPYDLKVLLDYLESLK